MRSTLAGRAALAGCLVALLSVLATAVVAIPVANQAARRQAADALALEADLLAAAWRAAPAESAARAGRVAAQLARQEIELWVVTDGTPDRAGLPDQVVARLVAGERYSGPVRIPGSGRRLLEGRPLGPGDAVVLTRSHRTGLGAAVFSRLWLPLLAGLAAGGAGGALLARRLTRPMRRVAAAAARLRGGDRQVRVPVEAPVETAELAQALNDLADALAASEDRQRQFLLSISHELRTPLTTINGYAEALADGVVDAPAAARTGTILLTEAQHLERLVADLLALARLAADDFPLELGEVDLTRLLAEAAAAWEPRFTAAEVDLRTDLPAEPVLVRTDPGRLRQVLDGLLGNALRVVPAGAPVLLEARTGPGGVVIEVRDGGPGLTDADLAVAFDRGALAARYRGVRKVGSGLGLALAARLVRRLGGTIVAGHADEGGARFTVTLPDPYQPRTSS